MSRPVATLLAFLSLTLAALADTKSCPAGLHLRPGATAIVTVIGSKPSNDTGVVLRAGESYSVRVFPAGQTWVDLFIKTNADGFSSKQRKVFQRFDHELRIPGANWLSLGGQAGQGAPFSIGTGTKLCPREHGRLSLFANDVTWGYWDNIGSLKVAIHRLK